MRAMARAAARRTSGSRRLGGRTRTGASAARRGARWPPRANPVSRFPRVSELLEALVGLGADEVPPTR